MLFFAVVCLALLPVCLFAQRLRLSNPLSVDRGLEVVGIPVVELAEHLHISAAQLSSLVAIDSATRQRIPSQLYNARSDADPDTLLLLVKLPAKGKMNVEFGRDPSAPPEEPLVFGRPVPERLDDFAWENEVVAYRIYGHGLEAAGEVFSGVDIWSKRTPNFVLNNLYKQDQEAARTNNASLSYHKDNGIALDSYEVGKSRGCGGTAVWKDGNLFASHNYAATRIIAAGPVRFEFEVTYAPWDAGGKMVSEKRRISLDAGSHMNKLVSTFTFDGGHPLDLAAGLAIHEGADAALPGRNIASVWDTPQDPTAGRIATGLVAPAHEGAKTLTAAHHELMIFERRSGEPFTYFAGSGWSKADMPTASAWNAYLTIYQRCVEHPITWSWTRQR